MFSKELFYYILNEINNKDFLTKEFLSHVKELIIKYNRDMKYVLNEIIVNETSNIDSYYLENNIILASTSIDSDYKVLLSEHEDIKDTLFVYNLNILDTLIHELTHAYQEYLTLNRNTLFTRIMKDGDNVQSGKFKYKKSLLNYLPKEVRGRVFYCEHHDIMPFELHANNVASMYCLKVYQEMKNLTDIPSYESIVLDDCLKEYSFENGIINPLTKFYMYSNMLDIMNSYNLKNLSSRNKFLLGYLRTALEINETFNKVMNTKNLDYVRIYKNGSVYKNE